MRLLYHFVDALSLQDTHSKSFKSGFRGPSASVGKRDDYSFQRTIERGPKRKDVVALRLHMFNGVLSPAYMTGICGQK